MTIQLTKKAISEGKVSISHLSCPSVTGRALTVCSDWSPIYWRGTNSRTAREECWRTAWVHINIKVIIFPQFFVFSFTIYLLFSLLEGFLRVLSRGTFPVHQTGLIGVHLTMTQPCHAVVAREELVSW